MKEVDRGDEARSGCGMTTVVDDGASARRRHRRRPAPAHLRPPDRCSIGGRADCMTANPKRIEADALCARALHLMETRTVDGQPRPITSLVITDERGRPRRCHSSARHPERQDRLNDFLVSCLPRRDRCASVVPNLHMRKIPIAILTCVVICSSVVVVGTLVDEEPRRPRRAARGPAQSKADFRIKEVHLRGGSKGSRWQLDAEQA